MEGVDYLADERRKAEFDVDSMKIVWAGSKHVFDVFDRISKLVVADPVFRKDDRTMLSRKDLFMTSLKKSAHAFKRMNELNLTYEEATELRFFVDEPTYKDLHWVYIIPLIDVVYLSENEGIRTIRLRGMSVSLSGPDGRLVQGGIAGLLGGGGPEELDMDT
ncbi:Peroxisomal acyl-coenzyme A oxidase 1 [Heracleum sosnowskyi]|uniref:Peroxisomal acyl-coenzyme A oxidase 1 n=1 Tax=Heracleum sosnowskyi TaxID=360622 RepID=A0AAD8N0A5_9APIA|nr:Peroxisomal acyl-coenzyme A oxidase 1 [Heracleum sosnowskyi]